MGSASTRRSTKEEYLRLIERQKAQYASKHPDVYSAPRAADWRVEVYRDVVNVGKTVQWAFWPAALLELLGKWDILMDEKWKSNLLWHDYMQTCNLHHPVAPSVTRSTLATPIPTLSPSSLSSQSLLDFLRSNLKAAQSHAIAAMISTFSSEFHRFYSANPTGPFELAIDIRDARDCEKVAGELAQFIDLCLRAFCVYYEGLDLPQLLAQPMVEIRELIVDLVFTPEVSEVVMSVYHAADSRRSVVTRNTVQYGQLRCEELGISARFCLDKERESSGAHGYCKAIEALKALERARTPRKRLSAVVKSAQMICECVDEYWGGSDVPREELVITPDQTLNIYLYLVLQANVSRLGAHIRVMQDFLRKDVLQSAMGYYISTLEATLENISLLSADFFHQASSV